MKHSIYTDCSVCWTTVEHESVCRTGCLVKEMRELEDAPRQITEEEKAKERRAITRREKKALGDKKKALGDKRIRTIREWLWERADLTQINTLFEELVRVIAAGLINYFREVQKHLITGKECQGLP